MDFFTKIDIPAADFKIDYTSRLAFFGSCFADNISAQFAERKFHVLVNPFGTVYNPVSLAGQIKAIADGKIFGEEDVFQDTRCDGLWHCWDAHSSLSGATKEECIEKLNAATAQARGFLQKADTAFITLGSAFVYYLKDIDKPVSNCHRQDPHLFERRLISVEEASQSIQKIVALLRDTNCNVHIVFTVSPLRHMSDGAHNNTLSKSTLQLAIHSTTIDYFPSYEIVMDELRDYRFYAEDMIHLSKTAEEYIFERMTETYCDSTTRENMAKVEKFLKMANHRIQDESSPATQELKKKLAAQALELEKQIPGLKLG
ncbi:GSCFA domain-containing protein [Fibrobacter sp. UWB5]|uniref:GSCFA domain-containing protein n=1 Tax=Fibrobacter sp. UWB5 TaxID=1964360 RepID=UPI000B51FC37|nr:GSCFA domain-containing protein [Fibrobacter sp. UWB5]OWV14267.1 hypothetical protein B7989_02050 [Fibrobacter sp. UWB5]